MSAYLTSCSFHLQNYRNVNIYNYKSADIVIFKLYFIQSIIYIYIHIHTCLPTETHTFFVLIFKYFN